MNLPLDSSKKYYCCAEGMLIERTMPFVENWLVFIIFGKFLSCWNALGVYPSLLNKDTALTNLKLSLGLYYSITRKG